MHRFEPFPVFRTKVIRLIGTPWTWAGIVAAWIVADPLKDFAFGDKTMSVALLDISAKIAAMAENPNVRVAMIPVVFFCFWRAASQIIKNDDSRTARVVQTTEDSAKRIIEARNSDFEIPLMMAKAAFRGEEIGTLEKAIKDFQVEFERYRNDTARWMGDEIFPVNHTDMPPDPFQYFHGISMWPYYSFAIPEWGGEWQNPPIYRTQDDSGGDFMHRVQHYDGTQNRPFQLAVQANRDRASMRLNVLRQFAEGQRINLNQHQQELRQTVAQLGL